MNKIYLSLTLVLFFIASCAVQNQDTHTVSPLNGDLVSIAALQQTEFAANLQFEKTLVGSEKYESSLMSYSSDGLKIFTLVNKPTTAKPSNGFPVVIFGHGFHPTPEKYGVSTSTGKDWRPGDYYRGIPEAYAEKGYLVLTSDYRGHNVSEGFAFTKTSYLASSYYARDVLNLVSALGDFENADLNKIYYMGHSMGGDVGLKVLLASNEFKAASLWAPVVATTPVQALYYGNLFDEISPVVDSEKMDTYMEKINSVYASLPTRINTEAVDPVLHLESLSTPLIIHHARGDTSVPFSWSESLIVKLHDLDKEFEFYAYDSDMHLFNEENRKIAVERDINFFNAQ